MTKHSSQTLPRRADPSADTALTTEGLEAILDPTPSGTPTSTSRKPIELEKSIGTLNGMAFIRIPNLRLAENGALVGATSNDSSYHWDHGHKRETQTQSIAGIEAEIELSRGRSQDVTEIFASRGPAGVKVLKIKIELSEELWKWALESVKQGEALNFCIALGQVGRERLQGQILDYHR